MNPTSFINNTYPITSPINPTFLFGSCYNPLIGQFHEGAPSVGPAIAGYSKRIHPAAFVWGGDAVYGDKVVGHDVSYFKSVLFSHSSSLLISGF